MKSHQGWRDLRTQSPSKHVTPVTVLRERGLYKGSAKYCLDREIYMTDMKARWNRAKSGYLIKINI